MRFFGTAALAICLAGPASTAVTAQEPSKNERSAGNLLSGEIVAGHQDQLSAAPGVTPPAGFDPFESLREELAQNREEISTLRSEVDDLDQNAAGHATQREALMLRIKEFERRNMEIQQALEVFAD